MYKTKKYTSLVVGLYYNTYHNESFNWF